VNDSSIPKKYTDSCEILVSPKWRKTISTLRRRKLLNLNNIDTHRVDVDNALERIRYSE